MFIIFITRTIRTENDAPGGAVRWEVGSGITTPLYVLELFGNKYGRSVLTS